MTAPTLTTSQSPCTVSQDVDVAQSILTTCNNCMDIKWAAATTKLLTE